MSNNPYKTEMRRRIKTSTWLLIGVITLIVLIFGWLTLADLSGDTDVSAPPVENVE